MDCKTLTRRRFLENSLKSGVAAGLGLSAGPLHGTVAELTTPMNGWSLKVAGDAKEGFGVQLLFAGRAVAYHNGGGEFSGVFQNEERSVEDRVENWKASTWTGNTNRVTLQGQCALQNLNTTVFVEVAYECVTPHVVKKKIKLHQADMFLLFYQLSNRLETVDAPAKQWSFNRPDWQGGVLHEDYPAAGFRMKDGLCVGLLTDAGYRNEWTRILRRDGKPVKPGLTSVPDLNLYSGPSSADRRHGHCFIEQTFGEVTKQTSDEGSIKPVALPDAAAWTKLGGASLEQRGSVAILQTKGTEEGAVIPFALSGSAILSVAMEYRSNAPVALEVWRTDEQLHKVQDITLYNDVVPESRDGWTQFKTTVVVPGAEGLGSALFLSVGPNEQASTAETLSSAAKIEVRNLQVQQLATHREPYHRLEMDKPIEKTLFVFGDEAVPDAIRGYRLASQLYLADGLGFQGGDTEKVVYADLMMLCWVAGLESPRPIVAPSIWYSAAGEMYLRDSFYALNGIHNRELNERVFDLWGANQGVDGAINTLVEPNMANLERKSNDSTPLWLMWALVNQRRFGTTLPAEKIRKAAEYCMEAYDSGGDAACRAKFVMGQLDVIQYPEGTSAICENQGVFAVLLRVIKELRIPGVSEKISEAYIGRAEANYRSYYDAKLKFMRPARDIADAIGFAEIFPEFLSLWLFQRKLLTDEMVVSHLDHIPVMLPRRDCPHPEVGGSLRPIFIGLPRGSSQWSFFRDNWHPMVSNAFAVNYATRAMDGIYYNGGSWMRIEICGYVAGKLHGWGGWEKAIANRLWAEINTAPDFPTSQEYLATDPAHPFFGFHRVFAWNSFVLKALELAGLRNPAMDPDYRPGKTPGRAALRGPY